MDVKRLCIPAMALAATLVSAPTLANKVTGFYDSSAQINALLSSPQVSAALGNQAVVSLDAIGMRDDMSRVWRVSSETCDIRVALRPVSPQESGSTRGIGYVVQEPVASCD